VSLPELALQALYARLGWGVVLAAVLVGIVAKRGGSARLSAWVAVLVMAAMWLPGSVSPAYWLGLMCQYPSTMLVACCAISMLSTWKQIRPFAPLAQGLAVVLAIAGALLYADSSGWLAFGLYARVFDIDLAPALSILLGAAAVWLIRPQTSRATGLSLMCCVVVFSVARLPSGNLFDTLLDPLLWFWSVGITLNQLLRRVRGAGQRPALRSSP
jgi:hypothetical protein